MTTNLIEISQLSKHFGKTQALVDVSLSVAPGTVHGFLGPNGAGKSTTIRCLLGLIRPSGGRLLLNGVDPTKHPAQANAKTAYVPGDVQLFPNLTGSQVLDTLAKLRPAGDDPKKRAELIERFELDPSKKVRAYSKGNRQKVMLVAALAANVDVLVLDEPTSGLDPLIEQTFITVVNERRAEGAAVLLSSHILSEVQELADEISIIRSGTIVESGALDELSHVRGTRIRATLADGTSYDHIHKQHEVNEQLELLLDTHATNITATPASLEELFLEFYHQEEVARHA
ncbi:MAG: ABC transporter ATP-binding protein [Corynebacterium sp.]|nr:ABC transporter ATP-binding protein [Corynebacterium sp.]